MATSTFIPTAAALLLLLLSFPASTPAADTDSDLILDLQGNPLEVGSQYYMRRPLRILGPINRSPIPGQLCPLFAIETRFELDKGQPLKFIPENEYDVHIKVSSKFQIDSGVSPICRDDGIWRVGPINGTDDGSQDVVIASGVDVPRTWFRFEKVDGSDRDYKIVYCAPNAPPLFLCAHLGVFKDAKSGLKMLAPTWITSEAASFGFVKVSDDSGDATAM